MISISALTTNSAVHGQYLTHAHSHITRAVTAMDSLTPRPSPPLTTALQAQTHCSPPLHGNRSDLSKQIMYFFNKSKFLSLKNLALTIVVFQISLRSTMLQKRLTLSRLSTHSYTCTTMMWKLIFWWHNQPMNRASPPRRMELESILRLCHYNSETQLSQERGL